VALFAQGQLTCNSCPVVAAFRVQTLRMGKGRRVKFEKGGRVDKILKKQLKEFRKVRAGSGTGRPGFFRSERRHTSTDATDCD